MNLDFLTDVFRNLTKNLKQTNFLIPPILIGIFPVLSLYTQNIQETPYSLIVFPLLVVLATSTIGLSILAITTKNFSKSSIIVSLFWLFFYLYAPATKSAYSLISPNLVNYDSVLLPMWVLIFICGSVYILKSKHSFNLPLKFSTAIGVTICGLQILSILNNSINPPTIDNSKHLVNIDEQTLKTESIAGLPNIYFITPDSYPRSDTLSEYFNFDNSEFDNSLKKLGFQILPGTNSNYNQTGLSLPSTFNMSYFSSEYDINPAQLINLYQNNRAFKFLEPAGYRLRNNSSYFSTDYNQFADSNAFCRKNNEFLTELIGITALKPFPIVIDIQRQSKRSDILCTIDNIGSSTNSRNPTFEVTHLISPHPPYVFDEHGNDTTEINLSLAGIDRWYAKNPYINQLMYINERLVSAVEEILSVSDNSIIIIQSDHGTLSSASRTAQLGDKRPKVLKERSRNYTAIYLPEYCDDTQLYDTLTNVNTLRVVFNSCFDSDFKILEDKIYYAPAKIYHMRLEEITDKVR